jgi:DNA-binding transcriptional regulator GbsR (MarR family)
VSGGGEKARDTVNSSVRRVLDFLAELGPRWGLPAEPCRIHGYLYLMGRPVPETELRASLGLEAKALATALAWLSDYRLVESDGEVWRTESDPWELMLRALEERRRREIDPALAILQDGLQSVSTADRDGRKVALQIGKLLQLGEDLAAIDLQARRLSPQALRRVVGLGGRAARFMDRALGRRGR